jgi:hypothetical protein
MGLVVEYGLLASLGKAGLSARPPAALDGLTRPFLMHHSQPTLMHRPSSDGKWANPIPRSLAGRINARQRGMRAGRSPSNLALRFLGFSTVLSGSVGLSVHFFRVSFSFSFFHFSFTVFFFFFNSEQILISSKFLIGATFKFEQILE